MDNYNPAYSKWFGDQQRKAKKRNLEWTLSKEETWLLTQQPCHYCRILPYQKYWQYSYFVIYNGLDRVDSSKGYHSDNVVPCCGFCNRLKGIYTVAEVKHFFEREKPTMILVKKLDEKAQLPKYQTQGAACFDLVALTDNCIGYGTTQLVKTGLAMEIPKDTVLLVFPRGGCSKKWPNYIANNVGVIDEDYRGEILIMFANNTPNSIYIKAGDRIAQGMILPYLAPRLLEVSELGTTLRGDNGFGSTGGMSS